MLPIAVNCGQSNTLQATNVFSSPSVGDGVQVLTPGHSPVLPPTYLGYYILRPTT